MRADQHVFMFPLWLFDFYALQLIPVNSSIGLIEATDVDSQPLYYRLESATVS